MTVHIIECPYDSGRRDWRMGRGVPRLTEAVVLPTLADAGLTARRVTLRLENDETAEIAATFELQRRTAASIRQARRDGAWPFIVSGNCNVAAVGAVAGLDGDDIGVLWLDAHGDCETPETTESAFLDGMGLAMLTGQCWRRPLSMLPGLRPVPGPRVILAGARQLSDPERDLIDRTGITHVPVNALASGAATSLLAASLDRWRDAGVRRVYIHVDVDVLDPAVAPANPFNEPDGLGVEQVRDIIETLAHQFEIATAALTAYDPACDPEGKMPFAAAPIAERLIHAGIGRHR
ncbi:arginase family protein [Rhodospira trueperi]|uniref:Arginase n=1 Tax=Rhodospira trueperi TaxID=69960 RepID=A0A1G6XSZ8_9PROT|nr:arginase family protein [Rhodospira trueperi]SDD81324.1 arginase [Rhodospira trueperi]